VQSILISLLILLSHLCFFYAQWGGQAKDCGVQDPDTGLVSACPKHDTTKEGLTAGEITVATNFQMGSAGYAALEALTTKACYSKGTFLECPEGHDTTPASKSDTLCSLLECSGVSFNQQVIHLSYWFSLKQLWGMPGNYRDPPNCNYWHSKQTGEKCIADHPGGTAAMVLFAFSFVWPHLKLLLLHIFYYAHLSPGLRRNGLYWFAFFGKWSLADVLVMAVIIGLFNLHIDMSFVDVWENLKEHDWNKTCTAFCMDPYVNRFNHSSPDLLAECIEGCGSIEAVADRILSPTLIPESSLFLMLRLKGLGAVYAFCIAVLLSLSTGAWVDHIDDLLLEELRDERLHEVSEERRRQRRTMQRLLSTATLVLDDTPTGTLEAARAAPLSPSAALGRSLDGTPNRDVPNRDVPNRDVPNRDVPNRDVPQNPPSHRRVLSDGGHSTFTVQTDVSSFSDAPLLVEPWMTDDHVDLRYGMKSAKVDLRYGTNQPCCSTRAWLVHAMHVVLCLALLASLLCMQFSPNFDRKVTGGLPMALHAAGIDFDGALNMWAIPRLTAQEGGLDYLMAGCFVVFVLIGPLLRVVSLLLLLLLPMRLETQRLMYIWSRRLVAYTAVEVMLIATPLMGQVFGPISEKLLNAQILPICAPLIYLHPNPHAKDDPKIILSPCLRIDIYPLEGYWFNVASVVLLCVAGFDGSFTAKYLHRRLWPHDPHPPPSCIECCAKTKRPRTQPRQEPTD